MEEMIDLKLPVSVVKLIVSVLSEKPYGMVYVAIDTIKAQVVAPKKETP